MRGTMLAAVLVVALGGGRAEAQALDRHIDLSAGAGSAGGIGCDCYSNGAMFTGSVRYDVTRHFAVEGEIGRLGSLGASDRDSTWSGTVSFLGRSHGRIAFFGGGGPGFAATHRDTYYNSDPSGLTLHIVGGVEAWMTKRVAGFTSFTAQGAYTAGPTYARALFGVRIRVR